MKSEDIIAQVLSNVNRSDFTRTLALQFLNNRKDQICNFENFSFMETETQVDTVAGTQAYSLPNEYKDELMIYLVESSFRTPLNKWVGVEAPKSHSNIDTRGKPYAYWVWDDKVNLYFIPDGVYQLVFAYYEYLAAFTDVGDEENVLGEKWPDLLINGATSDGFHHFLMPDKAAEWEAKWNNEFQKLIRREGKRKYTNYTPRLKVRMR
jgi:hypothetical protein